MSQSKQPIIQNRKERTRVFWTLGITLIFLVLGVWYTFHSFSGSFHTRPFTHFFKEFGSYARIGFFVVLAHFVLMFILRKRYVDGVGQIKQLVISLSRIARQLHVPLAIIATGIVLIHAIGALLYGFTFDFTNSTGLLSLLLLLPLAISGIFRYKKMDRKWHWGLGLGFAVLFMAHSFL
ncbi:hypothetical protein DFP93_10678 [Aneurinibacillus soli]|uniref:Uncharacterized protein n=2 Tax=Aneurinibacillus soli TaxID=1500254 RepID=A0A0U5B154_9BACL|nr:hypothetical protein [Aneurinibacillus soli]PYE61885.1 hypothetical protein DFP93_10678 [Aneurinibacillus soli]BAU29701.1 hypothetical protein CB4_03938 [Aneurinibacillus soli]